MCKNPRHKSHVCSSANSIATAPGSWRTHAFEHISRGRRVSSVNVAFREDHPIVLLMTQAASWVAIVLTRALLAPPHGTFFGLHLRTVLTLCLVVLTQLIYRIAVHSNESNRIHSSST